MGVLESEGRRSRPRTISRTMYLCLWNLPLKAKTTGPGSKVSLLSQDGEVRVPSVRNELVGDVRDMIAGFLKNNRMEPSTSRRDNIGGVPACRSWIPLKNRETVLMMHEIAVGCINVTEPVRFGLTKFDHRKSNRIVGSR